MLVFLDFDGVLRRKQSPLYQLDAECLRAFEEVLRSLPGAEVVITSSWREGFSLGEMRKLFSPDIAARVVGVTPVSQDREGYVRYREVLAYLKWHGQERRRWIALDDDPHHYPVLRNVIVIDPERGFDAESAKRLARVAQPA